MLFKPLLGRKGFYHRKLFSIYFTWNLIPTWVKINLNELIFSFVFFLMNGAKDIFFHLYKNSVKHLKRVYLLTDFFKVIYSKPWNYRHRTHSSLPNILSLRKRTSSLGLSWQTGKNSMKSRRRRRRKMNFSRKPIH